MSRALLKIVTLFLGVIGFANAGSTYFDVNAGLMTNDNTLTFSGDVGYMMNRYLGFEGGITGADDYFMYDAAVKGVLPMGNLLELYGKIGVGIVSDDGSSSDTSVGMLYAGGVAFNLSHQWQLHVEDVGVTGSSPNMLMFGANYKF